MQGRRLPDNTNSNDMRPGDYIKRTDHGDFGADKPFWVISDPNGVLGTIGRINHKVEEHEDGTITVTPSIVAHHGGFHGFLERGVWRSC